jgi:L-seryl-tRNA(Ser) seleniumtransferase
LRQVPGSTVRLADDVAYVGGGSLPDQAIPTVVLEIEAADLSDDELARRLRAQTPAVMGRLREGKLVLDLRTVFPEQDSLLIEAIRQAL